MTPGALRALERFLLPNACVSCDRTVERIAPESLVCGMCRSRLRFLSWGCARCQQPPPPVGPCRFCAGWPLALRRVCSAVWLSDEAREIMHHLKYEGYVTLGQTVAALIVRGVPRPSANYLVPVPLSTQRYRSRGYNQATAIARGLSQSWGFPVAEGLLTRKRETESQTALTPEERQENVAGAFVAVSPSDHEGESGEEGQRGQEKCGAWSATGTNGRTTSSAPSRSGKGGGGAEIILVDDVLTTGATVVAAALALEAAGWSRVSAVTFARALPYADRATGA